MAEVKQRPILFSGEMVRAILDGRKTQTRRVVKESVSAKEMGKDVLPMINRNGAWLKPCEWSPYGHIGDRLWVRETWRIGAWAMDDNEFCIDYKADNSQRRQWLKCEDDELWERLCIQSVDDAEKAGLEMDENCTYHWEHGESPCRWRPSIHMPRWASRINLEITDVRVERIQDISIGDAISEGIPQTYGEALNVFGEGKLVGRENHIWDNFTSIENFRWLWDSINADRGFGWDVNPWVWALTFKRVD